MPPEKHEWASDDELYWREEAFGEHPVLNPWGDPHHPPEKIDTNND